AVGGTDEVAGLAQAFNEMAASLQEAEQMRRNMVADIAHELRTPLSVLQGNLQAVLDDVYPLDKGEIAGLYDETLILRRLVHDLPAHALRYTRAGGAITVEAAPVTGAVPLATPPPGQTRPLAPGFVQIVVRDTGPGIAAADLPHVFERFWRADRARSREQGGS